MKWTRHSGRLWLRLWDGESWVVRFLVRSEKRVEGSGTKAREVLPEYCSLYVRTGTQQVVNPAKLMEEEIGDGRGVDTTCLERGGLRTNLNQHFWD